MPAPEDAGKAAARRLCYLVAFQRTERDEMSVKASVSVTAGQADFARRLVERGRYPSLSAVVQHGLELLRAETELREAELAALGALFAGRAGEALDGLGQGRAATEAMIAAGRRAHGL
jgi:antitoxin ParD1/3/4